MNCLLLRSLFRGCADAEDAASVARCKVTVIFLRLVLYLLYIAIYMYNLMLYLAKNVWWKWKIISYFAPSTTRNASDGRLSDRVDDTRCLLIILWHLTVIDWLTNQSRNWISVKSLLIFSAIGSCLCVDGKCYRPYDRRLLPPIRSPGTSIDISPNWLYTCMIDQVKPQPFSWLPASPNKRLCDWLVSQNVSIANVQSGRTATDWLTNQAEHRLLDWLKPYPINRPPNHLPAQLRD